MSPPRKRIIALVLTGLSAAILFGILALRDSDADRQRSVTRALKALSEADPAPIRRDLDLLRQEGGADAECQLLEAALLLLEADFDQALKTAEAVPVSKSLSVPSKLIRAMARLGLQDLPAARDLLEQVLAEDPDNLMARQGLARMAIPVTPEGVQLAAGQQKFVLQMKPAVEHFCGDCHATPRPDRFPKSEWKREVAQGYAFYRLFDRHDLNVPDQELVQRYFELLAPESLTSLPSRSDDDAPASPFRKQAAWLSLRSNPAVAHILAGEADALPDSILFSDMRSGRVTAVTRRATEPTATKIAELKHPCRTVPCDLDGDGDLELLVAELGSFYPEDHHRGQVILLEAAPNGRYHKHTLLQGVGRISDIQPGDFDGDGDLDLIVAEFGWRTGGRILYLEHVDSLPSASVTASGQSASDTSETSQQGPGPPSTPKFRASPIDLRHGTIHVPVVDLNRDGRLDFIALISQEHEAIVAFIGNGRGGFSPQTIYQAEDPSYGSSGIELTDLDQDGDVDILYTNGDTFDSDLMKPYHGVQWLENQGELAFQYHHLGHCYGAYRAVAGDLDLDGDQDVVVVSALPVKAIDESRHQATESITCFFNDGNQRFSRRIVERGICLHATCDLTDLDDDGDLDLVVGQMSVIESGGKRPPLEAWINQTRTSPTPIRKTN